MKPTILAIFFIFFLHAAFANNLEGLLWETVKSDHFIVYYQEAPLDYVNKIIAAGEKYYKEITFDLGFTRFEGFWTFDKRAKIYLLKNSQDYKNKAQQPTWSSAGVNIFKREIVTYVGKDDFFENILPHEMGHIIFREFVGNRRKLPLWLDEGISSYLEKRFNKERLNLVKIMLSYGLFIDLEELEKVNIRNIIMPDLFYYESASVIDFLLEVYGKEKFFAFCNALKELPEYEDWRKALFSVYGFDSIKQLNSEWVAFLKR